MFDPHSKPSSGWRRKVYSVIFEHTTRAGLLFDVGLLFLILLSVVDVMLGTIESFESMYSTSFLVIEWILTGVFTIEYIVRLMVVRKARRYALSVLGIVDLLSILPTYLTLFLDDSTSALVVLRALRLFRVFRLFELAPFVRESNTMMRALWGSRFKIGVFLGGLLIIVTVQGAILYFVEPETFSNLPQAVYWAIVTVTTVGYGDIAPKTGFGQLIASVLMLMGYGIIAVPTGIVTVEMARAQKAADSTIATASLSHDDADMLGDDSDDESPKVCFVCRREEPDRAAEYCKFCGQSLQWLDGVAWVGRMGTAPSIDDQQG